MDYPAVQFDFEKFKSTVLYVCARCPRDRLGAVKLHKTLYYADMLSYALFGTPLTGSRYRKRPFGPTSDNLLSAIRELRNGRHLTVRNTNYFGYVKKEYTVVKSPDLSQFNENEIGLLDDVIDFVCYNNTAKTISEFSHNTPWLLTNLGDEIPYITAFHLFPTQVSEETLAWASKEVEEIETTGRIGSLRGKDFRAFREEISNNRKPIS